jgi:hypothetical protein
MRSQQEVVSSWEEVEEEEVAGWGSWGWGSWEEEVVVVRGSQLEVVGF